MLSEGVIVIVRSKLFEYPAAIGPAGPPLSVILYKSPLLNEFEQEERKGISVLSTEEVEVRERSSTYLSCAPDALASINLIKTLVNPSAPIFNVYCWYVVVGPVTDPLVVHVVPFGDVCTFKVHAVVLVLLLYQKDITPGLATKGNLIQSPTPLNVKFVVPVLTGVVPATIEFAVQVPLCVGKEVEKLSYM